jgi:hypothetical protein
LLRQSGTVRQAALRGIESFFKRSHRVIVPWAKREAAPDNLALETPESRA